jgi:hypothetical protein
MPAAPVLARAARPLRRYSSNIQPLCFPTAKALCQRTPRLRVLAPNLHTVLAGRATGRTGMPTVG